MAALAPTGGTMRLPALVGPGAGARPITPAPGQGSPHKPYLHRSATLLADPKMEELRHFIGSHSHEQRLRDTADLEHRVSASPSSSLLPMGGGNKMFADLRSEGIEVVDHRAKQLANEEALARGCGMSPEASCLLTQPPEDGDLNLVSPTSSQGLSSPSQASRLASTMPLPMDSEALSQRMVVFDARLQWRSQMDNTLKRLLMDTELAQDHRLKDFSHRLRCEHLDKTYALYEQHGAKEVRKERKAPAFLRFDPKAPVMPGSLRGSEKGKELQTELSRARTLLQLSRSASSPALKMAGAGAVCGAEGLGSTM